ncbi:hypothetical protein PDE_07731 [Penicillium oxalicum 114-2]|uniref:Uncharacterized protein n=1 Tax=Penicillium oxalicum (strain 114-2 / CGMCC 5302) TaxID=933388 RepID=S7ZVJ4_PENO1|nr:hypothetical protein PDE_07731 [Penicillium oxalicum 114-2]
MLPPEERRRILNRVIHQNPYDERPALWIYLLWLCLTTRTGSGNLPDFVAAEIETGYSSDFLQQGFLELADYGRTVQAVMRGLVLLHVTSGENYSASKVMVYVPVSYPGPANIAFGLLVYAIQYWRQTWIGPMKSIW